MADLTTPEGNLFTDDPTRAATPAFTEALARNRDALDRQRQAEIEAIKAMGGVPGRSAYEEAMHQGYVGTEAEWLASLEGPRGVSITDVSQPEPGVAEVSFSDGTTRTLTLPSGPAGHTPVLDWAGTALMIDGEPGPDLRGLPGTPGDDGHSPVLAWDGTRLVVDGVPGPDLKGEEGKPGEPGPPGDMGSTFLNGPGRPDQPGTTAGIVTGSEPVGTTYTSTDGAGVGAWVWRKRPTGWTVVDGDTGLRSIGGDVFIQRIRNVVYLTTGDAVPVGANITTIPSDWQPAQLDYQWLASRGGTTDISHLRLNRGAISRQGGGVNIRWSPSWVVSSAWPTTLPGSPA